MRIKRLMYQWKLTATAYAAQNPDMEICFSVARELTSASLPDYC